jgi:predicted phosphodiesterase
MHNPMRGIVLMGALSLVPATSSGQTPATRLLSTPWVELGENGQALARIVVIDAGDCPSIRVDGVTRAMSLRTPVPEGLRPACELPIPQGAKAASLNGRALALPRPNPSKIVAIGDTGCRIVEERVQDCNNPEQWPLERVAKQAAAAKPDLVIHVGDYLYREVACPPEKLAFCGGSPVGDHWEAWDADFFKPAAALLAAAPWALARGNHEDCRRAWRGWFYYLDPRPWDGACNAYSQPYVVKLGAFQLAVLDTSAVTNARAEEQVSAYAAQISSIDVTHAWLVDHHPFWLFVPSNRGGAPVATNATLQDAWQRAAPSGFDLVVSGHVHLFQVLNFDGTRPPQIVAGNSGTLLSIPVDRSIDGLAISGTMVTASETKQTWGYTLFRRTKAGWDLSLRTPDDKAVVACSVRGRQARCQPGK